jgi:hypothetical protein
MSDAAVTIVAVAIVVLVCGLGVWDNYYAFNTRDT